LKERLKWEVFCKEMKSYPLLCPICRWNDKKAEVVCETCGTRIKDIENKGVDVALATDLLVYGLTGSYDAAIIVSGDNDFIPVIEKLKERKPELKIEVAQFENAVGHRMRIVTDKYYPLDKDFDKFGKFL
jgi:uncharacterized LabA/DUF88 family protein